VPSSDASPIPTCFVVPIDKLYIMLVAHTLAMPNVANFAAWEGIILLASFLVMVLWKLFSGDIPLDDLLSGDARTGYRGNYSTFFSPGRAQMLMLTIVSATYLLLQVIQDPTKFPDVPNSMLTTLGGSQAVYLAGKAQALYFGRFRDLAELVLGRKP